MEPFIYKRYTITPNVHPADQAPGKWVFEAATITDSDGNEVAVAAPASEQPPLFDSDDAAARVCISQAKALIEAGDIG